VGLPNGKKKKPVHGMVKTQGGGGMVCQRGGKRMGNYYERGERGKNADTG